MDSERSLHPKTSHFRSPVCSSHVLTPHNASMNDPKAGLGMHQRGGWHCRCKVGLRKALLPQTPPISTSSMRLFCADATQCLNSPEAGLGLHQLGGGPSSGLHGNSKSDAVLDSWLIICVLSINNCCKKKICFGAKRPNYGQNRTVRWHRPCTV